MFYQHMKAKQFLWGLMGFVNKFSTFGDWLVAGFLKNIYFAYFHEEKKKQVTEICGWGWAMMLLRTPS